MIASYFLLFAMALATSGSSKLPGTQATCITVKWMFEMLPVFRPARRINCIATLTLIQLFMWTNHAIPMTLGWHHIRFWGVS